MSNALDVDLTGRVVLLKKKVLKPEFHADEKRAFRVLDGFGAHPDTIGTAIFGEFLCDGEEARFSGYDVERLAPEFEE